MKSSVEELHDFLMDDSTQYCCYCGTQKYNWRCCGEVHFESYRDMSPEAQQEFLDATPLDYRG